MRKPNLMGLRPRSQREWELTQQDLVDLQEGPAWETITQRLRYLQGTAVARGMAETTPEMATLVAKGENKAYARAIMVFEEVLDTVRDQLARAEEDE